MSNDSTGGSRHHVLEHLVQRLERDAGAFNPAPRAVRYGSRELPDRQPGTNLALPSQIPTGVAAVVMDCGISRRDGYTHVLWVSVSAESILGSDLFGRLAPAIASLACVSAYEWEGLDRLHLRAPGVDWDDMLRQARAVVTGLVS